LLPIHFNADQPHRPLVCPVIIPAFHSRGLVCAARLIVLFLQRLPSMLPVL
jgi:hypothetical protein